VEVESKMLAPARGLLRVVSTHRSKHHRVLDEILTVLLDEEHLGNEFTWDLSEPLLPDDCLQLQAV
jgi:hypothetical protein